MKREIWLVNYDVIADGKTSIVKTGSIQYDLTWDSLDDIKQSWNELNKQILDQWRLKPPCEVKITNAVLLGSDILAYQEPAGTENMDFQPAEPLAEGEVETPPL